MPRLRSRRPCWWTTFASTNAKNEDGGAKTRDTAKAGGVSEGNVFVGDFGYSAACCGLIVCESRVEVVATAARRTSAPGSLGSPRCGAFRAAAKHAEIRSYNFKAGALLSLFILPLTRLYSP